MSVPSANTTFDKTTPEKVWKGQDQPYWLAVDGGVVRGNVTITKNLVVDGTINGAKVSAPVTQTQSRLDVLTTGVNVNVFNPVLDIPLVNGATYQVFVQVKARVQSGTLLEGCSILLNVQAGATLPADPLAVPGALLQQTGISADVSTGGSQYWNTMGFITVPATGTNYIQVGMLATFFGTLVMSGGTLSVVTTRVL